MISGRELTYLSNLVRRPETVIFIGSGVSTWSDLPSWVELLQGLLDQAEDEGHDVRASRRALDAKNLLDAADKLPSTFRRVDITRTMRTKLRFGNAQPHRIHKLLTSMGASNFVTTNYDGLIEQQLTIDGLRGRYLVVTSGRVAEMADIIKTNARQFVFKPHGDVDDAASIVLSTSHYDEIMNNPNNQVRRTLEVLFLTRPVLFIGYSLNDPDTELMLRTLKTLYGGEAGELHAILPDLTTIDAKQRWDELRVRAFGYTVSTSNTGSKDHSGLLKLIEDLADPRQETDKPKASVDNADQILAAYVARFVRPKGDPSLPVFVYSDFWRGSSTTSERTFNGKHIEYLFEKCPGSYIVEGPAGSGKSFAIANYLSTTSGRIQEWINSGRNGEGPLIPVHLDARLREQMSYGEPSGH
jgi:hypothetical protein